MAVTGPIVVTFTPKQSRTSLLFERVNSLWNILDAIRRLKLNSTRNSWNRMVHHVCMYVDWRACDSRYESSLQEKARLNRAFSNWPLRTQLKCERSEGADRDRCSGISISRCSYLFEYLLLVHSIEISWVIRMVFLMICGEKLCYWEVSYVLWLFIYLFIFLFYYFIIFFLS